MELAIAGIVMLCTIGGALLGRRFGATLPQQHLGEDSRFIVKLTAGMIATLAALVLGLVTASAKSAFDDEQAGMQHLAADILTVDRLLARMGPECAPIRQEIRESVELRLALTWPTDSQPSQLDTHESTAKAEAIEDHIRALIPPNDAGRWLQARALDVSRDRLQTHWTVFGAATKSIQLPFLAVLVLWLTILFASFGVFAPRNRLAELAIVMCSLSVSSAIFLVLEMDTRFDGIIRLSDEPLRFALSRLGQ